MKKIIKTSNAPMLLDVYFQGNPSNNWTQFCNESQDGKKEIQSQLRNDQGNICAYCEIGLAQFDGIGLDDFRIEHFHPKKRPPAPPPNWDLEWSNLLGVCTGGNVRYIGNHNLYTSPDCSCDVPKADKNLDNVILNVLNDIPAFPPIFEFDEQGRMAVGKLCPDDLHGRAKSSIDELRLSPLPTQDIKVPRLIRFRKEAIDTLRDQLSQLLANGLSEDQAATELAKIYFSDDNDSDWPSFFSCIRWYLGPAAELRLAEINYDG